MSENHLSFCLGGEVTVEKLSDAFARFSQVLDALAESHNANIDWLVTGLEHGSATVIARAVPLDDEAERQIPAMHEDYTDAAVCVQEGNIDHTFSLHRRMHELLALADDDHPIKVESNDKRVVVDTAVAPFIPSLPQGWEDHVTTLGTVRGRVETLSRRNALSFSLYELTTDVAVRCFMDLDLEDKMRSVWGNIADVTGTVRRDTRTNRPLWIRNVTRVEPVDEGDPDGYLKARGVINTKEPAEVLVRRMRDEDCH